MKCSWQRIGNNIIKRGVVLLLMGILFLVMGFVIIFNQKYIIKKVGNQRNIERRAKDEDEKLNRYRELLSIFSIILGIFCLINYIIY